jgi:hypothetical protein
MNSGITLRNAICYIAMGLILLAGCSAEKTKQTSDDETEITRFISSVYEMDIEDINQSISLDLPTYLDNTPYANSYKPNSTIDLDVFNQTDKAIRFSADFDIKVFEYVDSQWVQVNDAVTNIGDYIELSNSSVYGNHNSPIIKPILENPDEEATIRVTVLGEILEDGQPSGEMVAAYLDITLKP